MKTLWVLCVTNQHGREYTAHPDEGAARAELADYARTWWTREGLPPSPPLDDAEALINRYFAASGEMWEIEECEAPWL